VITNFGAGMTGGELQSPGNQDMAPIGASACCDPYRNGLKIREEPIPMLEPLISNLTQNRLPEQHLPASI